MDESIGVSLERVKKIIDSFCERGSFTTADVLREYSGGFYCNKGVPPAFSFNALFGKLLKRNAKYLKITEIAAGLSINDDNGQPTKTSKWSSED